MQKLITFFNLKPNVNELWVNAAGDFQPTESSSFNKKVTREEVLGEAAETPVVEAPVIDAPTVVDAPVEKVVDKKGRGK